MSIIGGSIRAAVGTYNNLYEAAAAGVNEGYVHDAALILAPGYDFGTCAYSGECSTLDWGLATIGIIPGGKSATIAVKVIAGIGGPVLVKGAAVGAKTATKGEVFYKSTKEAAKAAQKHGFSKIKARAKNGEAVFYNKKSGRYISRDVGNGDGTGAHNGGVWKMATSVKGLGSKNTRIGTFDADLRQIGD